MFIVNHEALLFDPIGVVPCVYTIYYKHIIPSGLGICYSEMHVINPFNCQKTHKTLCNPTPQLPSPIKKRIEMYYHSILFLNCLYTRSCLLSNPLNFFMLLTFTYHLPALQLLQAAAQLVVVENQ